MRRLLIVAVVLLVTSATVLPAAGAGEAAGKDTVRVVYNNFSAGETNAHVLNAMLELFAEKYPEIEVVNDAMGYGDTYWTQLTTRIAGGNAPDAFEVNMENFVPYVTRNVMLPLDAYYEDSGAIHGVYSSAVLDTCSYKDTLYAVPQSYSTVMLIYNKNLYDEAGVAYPTEQWTWDDALGAAKAISNLGDDMWGLYNSIHFWEFYKVVQQNGGSLLSEDGTQFTINSPANLETLQYMVDRIHTHHVMPTQEERADRGEVDMFIEGRLGMFLGGVWTFNELNTRAPEGMRWGVEVEPGNTEKATHFFANVAAVSTDSRNPKETFTLLNFLGSDPGVVDLRLAASWELPTISDPRLVDAYISQTPPDNKEAVFRSLEYVVRPPALKQFNELASLVSTKLEMARDGILTPAEALDQAQEEAERTISLE